MTSAHAGPNRAQEYPDHDPNSRTTNAAADAAAPPAATAATGVVADRCATAAGPALRAADGPAVADVTPPAVGRYAAVHRATDAVSATAAAWRARPVTTQGPGKVTF